MSNKMDVIGRNSFKYNVSDIDCCPKCSTIEHNTHL